MAKSDLGEAASADRTRYGAAFRAAMPPSSGAIGGQEHEDDDGEQVLDDQPADGDPALRRVELVAVLEGPEEHDGARDRDREAKDEPAADAPAEATPRQIPRIVATDDLDDRAGDRDPPDGQEVPDREVDADAEHQQDHADLGQLGRDAGVGRESPA